MPIWAIRQISVNSHLLLVFRRDCLYNEHSKINGLFLLFLTQRIWILHCQRSLSSVHFFLASVTLATTHKSIRCSEEFSRNSRQKHFRFSSLLRRVVLDFMYFFSLIWTQKIMIFTNWIICCMLWGYLFFLQSQFLTDENFDQMCHYSLVQRPWASYIHRIWACEFKWWSSW